jgi:hypothetical protein
MQFTACKHGYVGCSALKVCLQPVVLIYTGPLQCGSDSAMGGFHVLRVHLTSTYNNNNNNNNNIQGPPSSFNAIGLSPIGHAPCEGGK